MQRRRRHEPRAVREPPAPGAVGAGATPAPTAQPTTPPSPTPPPPTPVPTATPPPAPAADPSLHVPAGFLVSTIAHVGGARELAALPNGDLIVGTSGTTVAIIPNAESAGAAGTPATFATVGDAPAQGVAYGGGFVFVATQHGVYRIPYASGAQSGTAAKIASVRTGPVAPNSDGDVHITSSVGVSGSTLYVGVGSSCNACAETDPTRATVQRMNARRHRDDDAGDALAQRDRVRHRSGDRCGVGGRRGPGLARASASVRVHGRRVDAHGAGRLRLAELRREPRRL